MQLMHVIHFGRVCILIHIMDIFVVARYFSVVECISGWQIYLLEW
jgi:hypothetical protein